MCSAFFNLRELSQATNYAKVYYTKKVKHISAMPVEVARGIALWTGICGIALLVCGVGSAGAGFAWIHYKFPSNQGLWSGIFLIVPGVLGILVWTKRNPGVMIGFLTMCIIAIIVSGIQAIIAGNKHSPFRHWNGVCPNTLIALICELIKAYVGLLLAIIIFNGVGAVLGLAGSILGCISACNQEPPPTVVVQQPATMVTLSTAQGAYVGPMGYSQQPVVSVQQPGGYPQQLGNFQQQQQYGVYAQQTAPPPEYMEKPGGQMY